MNLKNYILVAYVLVILSTLIACNDRGSDGDTDKTTKDTNYSDTRRNTGDTSNYIVHDSTNLMNPTYDTSTSNRK